MPPSPRVFTTSPEQSQFSNAGQRPFVGGKFLFAGREKLYIRGVTYGTFRPDENGDEFPSIDVVELDFKRMAANGINAVRTYTAPPRWLLDCAQRNGLRIMVGLSAERYVGYLNDGRGAPDVGKIIREKVCPIAAHPAILCYTIGNEIPSSIVRWFGRRRIERYLHRLYRIVKAEDPQGLVTYVNYPSTEYLQLTFLDFSCFNVYLEARERLDAYLARLHNIAGDKPLVMAEIGLDSLRNGADAQAEVLEWQVRTVFAAGCAGAFVYAWTDEWFRGGAEVDDWAFGLTDRERQPKPALATVRRAFSEIPFPSDLKWPRISVVVCSCNGAQTIRDCFEGLREIDYPDYEVIVVNDGSTDRTATIAKEFGFRLISTENCGLSNARNTGMRAATGEIVAYTDDDARPDPQWLKYLAFTFMNSTHVGVGGPNIAPPGDGAIADCVANSPGGPVHVLLSDRDAEHIPGCNMAFRKDALQAIGGFDPIYRAAGDDVDVCWRLQQQGWTLGFNPAAMVWHHRRNSVRTYWKQQKGYGKAEALLESKWPEKYNHLGHLSWAGRMYGKGLTQMLGQSWRIYHGTWGTAPFQSRHQLPPKLITLVPLMTECYLLILCLLGPAIVGLIWKPLLLTVPLLILVVFALLAQALASSAKASFVEIPRPKATKLMLHGLTAFLHLLQPIARLYGRLKHGLHPWRRRGICNFALPKPRTAAQWTEQWQSQEDRLRHLEKSLQASGAVVRRGGSYDRWDLEVRGGMFGSVRMFMAVEEHGGGAQYVRLRSWPRIQSAGLAIVLISGLLAVTAITDGAWVASAVLGLFALLFAARILIESADATGNLLHVVDRNTASGGLSALSVKLPGSPATLPVLKRSRIGEL